MANIIEVKNLVKNYGDVKAVKDVSFTVREGSFFALLGTNGAGKTTTINIINGILEKTSGQVFVDGMSIDEKPEEIKKRIGVVFQESVLDNLLTVKENLQTRASFYGISGKKFEEVLDYLNKKLELNEFLNRQYKNLSGGQRRKADIARALINQPKILILDEPTTGLDPKTRIQVWSLINELKNQGKMTIFLTTHYMEETSKADKVIILNKGKIKAQGSPTALKNKYSFDTVRLYFKNKQKLVKKLEEKKIDFEKKDEFFELILNKKTNVLTLLNEIEELVDSFEVIKGDMDAVFLAVTGKKLKGENK